MDKKRTFQQIAKDIKSTWLNVYFGAVPYLEAMLTLDTSDPNAMYFMILQEILLDISWQMHKHLEERMQED